MRSSMRGGPGILNSPVSGLSALNRHDMPRDEERNMNRRPRRNHSVRFKAKVAMEAANGEQTLVELAKRYDGHPKKQITQRKTQSLERAAEVFERSGAWEQPPVDAKTLHAKLGELTLANDFLEGALTKTGFRNAKR